MGALTPSAVDYSYLMTNYDDIKQKESILSTSLTALAPAEAKKHIPLLSQYREEMGQYHLAREATSSQLEQISQTIHDNLGITHLRRISSSFTILTTRSALRIANDAKWFDALNRNIAPIFDFNQTLTVLNLPVDTFNVLSVAVLGLRFLIESARILQHTFLPTEAEKATSAWDRFCHEAHKYRFNMANDVVWATLNALGNFPGFFNLSVPLANNLMLICCFFDISLLIYRYRLTANAYLEQKTAYASNFGDNPDKALAKQCLDALETDHIRNTAELQISLFASSLLTLGFGIFLTSSIPIFSPAGTLLCVTAMAICTAAGLYADYQKATHLLAKAVMDEKPEAEIQQALEAQQTAWNQGWATFAESLCAPIILIGTLALYWPAGLLVLTGYAAYKLYPTASENTVNPTDDTEEPYALPVPAC
jgi:hypothetical protein